MECDYLRKEQGIHVSQVREQYMKDIEKLNNANRDLEMSVL